MLKKYINDYLSVNLKDYDAFGIDLEISKVILIILVLFCCASFMINHYRSVMSLTVKKFFRHKAFSEQTALSLKELELDGSRSVKRSLSSDTRLSKLVTRLGATKLTIEEYKNLPKNKKERNAILNPDFENARFYIASENMDEARNIHDNYTASIPKTCLFCFMLTIIFISITLVMPALLSLLNDLLAARF